MKNYKIYWELFVTFFKIGAFTFGGGYAMLPLIQKELVEDKKWATEEEVLDYYAIGQSTPGIIAVNTATFLGYKQKKIPGAIVATLGIVMPSLIIISLLASFFSLFLEYEVFQKAFKGVNVVVAVLLISSVIKMGKKSIISKSGIIIFIAAFLAVVLLHVSTIWIILTSILLGLLLYFKGGHKD